MGSWNSDIDPFEKGGCPMCCGLRGHARLRKVLYYELDKEYRSAKREAKRLGFLYKEACWYNFETQARHWNEPWHETNENTRLCMHSHKYGTRGTREVGVFDIYYYGIQSGAPPLPPEIVASELRVAQAYEKRLEEERFAPYDWAPGGRKYEQHRRECETAKILKC